MKNAMKKLMSLVLVAVLLVSAVPFAVSADETCTKDFNCQHTGQNHIAGCPMIPCTNADTCDHGGYNHAATCPKACDGTVNCPQYAAGHTSAEYHQAGCLAISKAEEPITNGTACTNSYDCKHFGNNHIAGCPMIPCSNDATCDHGGWNHLETCPYACKNSSSCHAWYHLDTCPMAKAEEEEEDTNSGSSNSGSSNSGLTDYTKFAYPVYLNIYTDTTVGTVKKTINITEGIAADGIVTLKEVKGVVDYYYNAVNTDKGIQVDGLYPAKGNWVHEYAVDTKYERIEGLYEAAAESYVYINVMVTNAKLASSSTADSSNPKTGDMIFAPIAVMTVSASALALFFFLNKKRAI